MSALTAFLLAIGILLLVRSVHAQIKDEDSSATVLACIGALDIMAGLMSL